MPVHGFGIEQGAPWMAMRLVTGGSLADRVRRGPLAPREVAALLRDVAGALDYAHARGVVHRDVKPANVLLDEAGRGYLADFGVARMLEGSAVTTATGMIQGTPSYMAPEQAMGEKVDRLADVYALGIVAFECLTGRVPYTGTTPVAILMKHVQEPVPEPTAAEVTAPDLGRAPPLPREIAHGSLAVRRGLRGSAQRGRRRGACLWSSSRCRRSRCRASRRRHGAHAGRSGPSADAPDDSTGCRLGVAASSRRAHRARSRGWAAALAPVAVRIATSDWGRAAGLALSGARCIGSRRERRLRLPARRAAGNPEPPHAGAHTDAHGSAEPPDSAATTLAAEAPRTETPRPSHRSRWPDPVPSACTARPGSSRFSFARPDRRTSPIR